MNSQIHRADSKTSSKEAVEYEDSLKSYRDLKNSLDTAKEEGRAEGRIEGKAEVAKLMLLDHEPIEKIIRLTGLTKQQIEKITKG